MKFLARLLLFLLLISNPVFAVQYNPVLSTTSPYPGLTMLSNANSSYAALLSNNSGATAPTYGVAGTIFMNTTNSLFEVYTGSNWVNAGTFTSSQFATINNGVPYTVPASTGSSNAYVVTYSPAPTAYVTGQHYPFISNFANTTTATENVNTLGAKQIKKQGTVGLASADIPSGAVVDTVYDGTFMQMVSQVGNSSAGTVSSIATTSPVCGGTIVSTGTVTLCTQADGTILSNISGSTAAPSANSLSSVIDHDISSTVGGLLYRGASVWSALAASSTGAVLQSVGGTNSPAWTNTISVKAFNSGTSASSSTFWRGDGTWATPVAGGLVLLNTQNVSNVAAVTFSSTYITSTYKRYKIIYDGAYDASTSSAQFLLSINGGSSYSASSGGLAIGNGTFNTFYLPYAFYGCSSPSNTCTGEITFNTGASGVTQGVIVTSAGGVLQMVNGNSNMSGTVNAVQISGSQVYGEFSLYGIAQ